MKKLTISFCKNLFNEASTFHVILRQLEITVDFIDQYIFDVIILL